MSVLKVSEFLRVRRFQGLGGCVSGFGDVCQYGFWFLRFCAFLGLGVWVRAVQKECLDNGRAFYGFWVSAFLDLGMFLGLRVQGSWFLV